MSRWVGTCTWDDVPHLSAEQKADLLRDLPPYQRDARSKGVPQLGSGAIYPVPESDIVCAPFDIPTFWPRAYALDVGWNRTAAIWGALYLYSEHYRGQAEPAVHAEAIRARGAWMNGTIDPASRGRGQKDGQQLFQNYIDLGLTLVPAKNGVEAGIMEVLDRMSSGRLKVFGTLQSWLAEYRIYRRDDHGKIVKKNDHLMDATRYLVVMLPSIEMVMPNYLEKGGFKSSVQGDYDPYA